MVQTHADMTVNELLDRYAALNTGGKPIKSWKKPKTDLVKIVQKAEAAAKAPRPTIRAFALELLCEVAHHEDRTKDPAEDNVVAQDAEGARTVGLPYDTIIEKIKERFPECNTSIACLRWYAVKVRAEEYGYEDLRLPQRRPRVGHRTA